MTGWGRSRAPGARLRILERPKARKALQLLLKVVAPVFLFEALIMAALAALGIGPFWSMVVDPIVLSALIVPLLWWTVIKPIVADRETQAQAKARGEALRIRAESEHDMELARRAEEIDAARLAVLNMAADLERMREATEAANKSKSEFLANMSHEIRTPLTAILGYADLLTDSGLKPSQRKEYVETIRTNGEHLLQLINDILDLSKIEAGKSRLEQRRCSVVSVVADVLSMMRVSARQGGISLDAEFPTPLPDSCSIDEHRLRQILVNLVGNAIKFTSVGGVRVVTSFEPNWREGRAAVRVEVIDTGIGMPPEAIKRLGEPFVQADASTTRQFGGTGLGLAITRRILDMMEGQLAVESAVGKGSTFVVTIPIGPLDGVQMLDHPAKTIRAASSPTAQGAPPKTALSNVRVLFAEDAPVNQTLIATVLEKSGATVTLAANGIIALATALAEQFDVILMDMQMPEMDGYEATRRLREAGYRRPIIALTANALAEDRNKCLSVGCDDYLAKPIDRSRLIATVARHAGTASAMRASVAENNNEPQGAQATIISQFADDPDLRDVIDEFVSGLDEHVLSIRHGLNHGDHVLVRRLAHQLKGAGGSYGYQALTEAAKRLEDAASVEDIEDAALALGELAAVCKAAQRGRNAYAATEAGEDRR